jgi:hypothetical protein
MMNKILSYRTLLVLITFVGFSIVSCYMDVPATAVQTVFLQARDQLGDSGNGHYLVVRVYHTADMDSMLNGDPPEIEFIDIEGTPSIQYSPIFLIEPVMIFAGFIAAESPPSEFTLVMPVVPVGTYKLLVEHVTYYGPEELSIYNAGVTEAVIVQGSKNIEVDVDLIYYYEPFLPN